MTAENAQRSIKSPPVALTIAGSDSSAGAGIQTDLKTFGALGVYGLTAVTCVVAETPGKVSRIEPMTPEIVRDQIKALAKGFPIAAVKTGLLCSGAIVAAVAKAIVDFVPDIPLVIDPVMIATSGAQLLEPAAIEIYERDLFPRATLITPNLDEGASLLGTNISDKKSMEGAVRALSQKYNCGVLLKGGHLAGDQAIDLMFANGKTSEFSAPFVRNVPTHGTGCTYSAAIAAGLACGSSLEMSVRRAKDFVSAAIRNHFTWGEIHALNVIPSREKIASPARTD